MTTLRKAIERIIAMHADCDRNRMAIIGAGVIDPCTFNFGDLRHALLLPDVEPEVLAKALHAYSEGPAPALEFYCFHFDTNYELTDFSEVRDCYGVASDLLRNMRND